MPSRVMHDLIRHLIETGDVHYAEPIEQPLTELGGFYRMYMGNHGERMTLRRVLREGELEHLPVNIYQEFLELLESWMRSGHPMDVGRFRDVRLIHVERMMSPENFGYDFRLEFSVGEYNHSDDREQNYAFAGTRRSAMLRTDSTGGLEPVYTNRYEPRMKDVPVKKVEEHFDKDLFEV